MHSSLNLICIKYFNFILYHFTQLFNGINKKKKDNKKLIYTLEDLKPHPPNYFYIFLKIIKKDQIIYQEAITHQGF